MSAENKIDYIEMPAKDPAVARTFFEGLFDWKKPPLAAAQSLEMSDLLMELGADVSKVGQWWAPGFGLAIQLQPNGGSAMARTSYGFY